jgi:hypothetical protein
VGWLLVGLSSLGGLVLGIVHMLRTLRKEAKLEEPEKRQHITGGPVEVTVTGGHVTLTDHEKHKTEVWTVINGLRRDIGEIKEDVASIRALREANGERMGELSRDVAELNKTVAHLAGVVEAKLQRKG